MTPMQWSAKPCYTTKEKRIDKILTQRSLAIRNSNIKIVLLPMLVDTKTLKVDISTRAELRLDRAGDVDGALHSQVRQPVLEDLKVDGDDTRHLDRTAEADLAVALAEVQVADAELGAIHVHREVDLAAA